MLAATATATATALSSALVVFFFVVFRLGLIVLIGHLKNLQQISNLAAELFLIFRKSFELAQQLAATLLDQRPPDVDESFG